MSSRATSQSRFAFGTRPVWGDFLPPPGCPAWNAGTFALGSWHSVPLIQAAHICYLVNFGSEGAFTAAKVRH